MLAQLFYGDDWSYLWRICVDGIGFAYCVLSTFWGYVAPFYG